MSIAPAFTRLRAILFDMDGLIVDTEPIHFAAFQEYLRRKGGSLPESVMRDFVGFSERDNLRKLKRQYAIADPLEQMVMDRRAIYLELVRTRPVEACFGFWEFSADARRRGLKQAVVSSAAAVQVELVLQRLFERRPEVGASGDYFDAVVSGDDVAHNKPAPDVYLAAAARLGVEPRDCLALEDSPPGAQSAVAAGAVVVAVTNSYTAGLDFTGVYKVVSSLDAVCRELGWVEIRQK